MTKDELLEKMESAIEQYSIEERHRELDSLLLEYVGDERVTKLFDATEKWYA